MNKFIYLFLLLAVTANADEWGLRVTSRISSDNNAVVQFPPGPGSTGYDGKMVQGVYDLELDKNFYVEGALGYRSDSDVLSYASLAGELSPGFRVSWSVFKLKLSEGVSYMPQNSYNPVTSTGYQQFDLVTHLTLGLKDKSTGIGIYFDRSHYSNGSPFNNPSLNYTGFQVMFPY